MSELIFPDDLPGVTWPLEEEHEDTSITSKFEDGSMQSRTKFTRSRRIWTVKWRPLTRRQYVRLKNFIVNEAKFAANPFEWRNPDNTREVVTVRCTKWEKASNDTLKLSAE